MKTFLAFSLLAVTLVCGCNKSSKPPASASSSTPEPPKPIASLTSEELLAEFQKNAIGAERKYKNQLIEVSGPIGKIGKSLTGYPFVSLGSGSEEELFGVTCYLTSAATDEAAKLQPGANVKLRGTCMGQLGGQALRLQDCVFVK